MKKKIPYESPELLIFRVANDIITDSFGNNPPQPEETESENDDWGAGFQPF